jgi:hypothetical protein
MECYSAIKKNEILLLEKMLELDTIMLNWNQPGTQDKYHDVTHVESAKVDLM